MEWRRENMSKEDRDAASAISAVLGGAGSKDYDEAAAKMTEEAEATAKEGEQKKEEITTDDGEATEAKPEEVTAEEPSADAAKPAEEQPSTEPIVAPEAVAA